MVYAPRWIKDWRQRRQAKSLSKKLHRRLEHSGGVRQLILNNVCLHEGALQSISESVQDSYRGDPFSGSHLKTLTVRDCHLRDYDTIRVLISLMQSQMGYLDRVSLINNSIDASHPLTKTHLRKLVDALGVVKHIVVGPEFINGTEGVNALCALCARALTLELVNFPFGFDDETDDLPRDVSPSISLRGLYRGIKSRECRVQTIVIQGTVMDDNRFGLLVDSMCKAKESTPASARSSSLTVKHLKLTGHCLHSRSCSTLIRLLESNLELETLEMDDCAFLASINDEQGRQMGQILANDSFITSFALLNVHLTDSLATPLFRSLEENDTLLHFALTTKFEKGRRERFPPVSTTGYQALLDVLPNLSHLQSLRLGQDFYFSSRMTPDFVEATKIAISRNGSILVYEGGEAPPPDASHQDQPRYGYYHELVPTCQERNQASLVVDSMLKVAYDVNFSPSTWQAAILHMSARLERQTALYQLLRRVLTDPQASIRMANKSPPKKKKVSPSKSRT